MREKCLNFMKTHTKNEKDTFIKIVRNYYYNNDLPCIELQNKMKKWFNIESLIEIEEMLSNIKDSTYDEMLELANISNLEIGSVPNNKKCNLDKYMGSLDKIKTENEYLKWKINYNKETKVVITEKLDGISALLTIDKNISKLCTRGNGIVGCDISHIISYINIEKSINIIRNNFNEKLPIIIRGELILPFQNNSDTNLRNIVSGLVHTKELTNDVIDKIKNVEFVTYRMYNIKSIYSKQLTQLKNLNFKIPLFEVESECTFSRLKQIQEIFSEKSKYQIDGIVITDDSIHRDDKTGKNPEHSIAFKLIGKSVESEVSEIEWNVSKYGIIKPRIKIKQICINGANIEWVTGFNAKYISENMIGKGTILEIERSGDVIPNIKKVIKSTISEFPTNIKWEWNKTRVDIQIFKNEENDDMEIKKILTFFQEIECPFLGPKTIEVLYKNGFNDIKSILSLTKDDLINICKYKDKSSENILQGIKVCNEKLNIIPIHILMHASGCFGFGFASKKIKNILDVYPDIKDVIVDSKNIDKIIKDIKQIKGIDNQAEIFVKNIETYRTFEKSISEFLGKTDKIHLKKIEENFTKIKLKNQNITFTGFRDANLKKILEQNGNTVSDNITKNTNILIYKNDENSTKYIKAKNNGIKLVSIDDFLNIFM